MQATENELLKGLNNSQKEAVLKTEGRYLVLAGAGSGKTKALTTRGAYLLEQGIDPWRILVITFTNKAAKEMKERMESLNPNAYKCWIGTFHGICNRILQSNIQVLGLDAYTLMDRNDQAAIIKSAALSLGLEVDKAIVRNLISQISLWKNEGIGPGDAQSLSKGNQDKTVSAYVYEQYEVAKEINGYYDFDDLLIKTVRMFQNNPELLARYQRTFQYVMVDEFQDTNKIQYELIEMLSAHHENTFFVGDPDQSIYSFRSAKIENILGYTQSYPDTEVIRLEENYRSTETIVNASNALVEVNQMRLDREAHSMSERGDNIQVIKFNDPAREAGFIARLISNIRKREKRSWSEFALLYRVNFQSQPLELALRDENIPYRIVGNISFYDRKEIKDLISYVRAIHNPADDYAILKIINVPKRGIGDTTMKKVSQFARERAIPIYTALQNIDEVAAAHKMNKPTIAKIKKFMELLNGLVEDLNDKSAFNANSFLHQLIRRSEFMSQFDPNIEEDETRIENITQLRNYAKQWDSEEREINTLAQFVSEISLDGQEEAEDEDDYVTLTSTHSAKGLEWSHVFIIGAEDGLFPHFRSKNNSADLEEERRLMYVAMTRAKHRLFITHSAYKFERGSSRPIPQKPSPFLEEIPENYKTVMIQTA